MRLVRINEGVAVNAALVSVVREAPDMYEEGRGEETRVVVEVRGGQYVSAYSFGETCGLLEGGAAKSESYEWPVTGAGGDGDDG